MRKVETVNGFWSPAAIGRRLWRYVPLLLWLMVIFNASGGRASAANTSRVFGPLLRWFFPNISEDEVYVVHVLIRKLAHLVTYAILALLAARASLTSSQAFLRANWFTFSFALVAVWSLLDEYRQSFSSARTGTIYDSLLDIVGGGTALLLIKLWRDKSNRSASRL